MSATYGVRHVSPVAESAALKARLLYERHGQRVFTFCVSRLRDAQEAQDATQTTFLYALRALDKGTTPRFELAWLLTIAKNVCRATQRTLNRRQSRLVQAGVTEVEAAATQISEDTGDELAWLRSALEQLPENQRRAILLREWQGLSYADIAAELQLSLGAVEALLFRARRALEAQLKRAKAGLEAVEFGWVGLAWQGARRSAAFKAAMMGAGVAVAVGPVVSVELYARSDAGHRHFNVFASASRHGTASASAARAGTRSVGARAPRGAALRASGTPAPRPRPTAAPAPSAPSPQQSAPPPDRQEPLPLTPAPAATSVVDTAVDGVAAVVPPARPALEQARSTLPQANVPAISTPGVIP